ncbi:hypothetical protein ACFVUY_29110 [Kitasatospora sp. NPDC058063]|uniref:hypothetical protein n=1 Tax=unclassified Kitasatospora TaxID=2633591 RepID=UPI0036DAC536
MLRAVLVAGDRSIGSIKQREEWSGHKIGVWINSFRNRRASYDADRIATLEDLPGWAWTPQEDSWNATLAELSAWAAEYGRMPRAHAADIIERRLGVWRRNNKSKRHGRTDDYQAIRLRALLAQYGERMP